MQLGRTSRRRRKFRRGHAPYLGKIRLFWCDECNVPRFEETECSICKSMPRKVHISPPGDPFPAMDGHLERAILAINRQFGEGIGERVLPPDKTIVMNKVPSLDAMYEVVVDGHIVGRLRFDIPEHNYTFLLTLEGGRRIGALTRVKWVSLHDGVLKFLKDGANLMVPGVAGCDSGIQKNDEVMLMDSDGVVVGAGIARMSGADMAREEKGYAVKMRDIADPSAPNINPKTASWDDAVQANENDLILIEEEATNFIKRTAQREDAPVVVGFSGGKDSLVVYLLVEKALGLSPPMFFVNTGLEFPETIRHIEEFAETHNVTIIGHDSGEQFWDSVDVFGPPARDFRWCCKVLKLGPAAKSIAEKLGGHVLTFMGQRKLESFQRSQESRVSSNPWVPGQRSANPIQKWNALEVWLYIFRENASFNLLYNRGYHRMGCYLCPSSPLGELESIRETHPALFERWNEKLRIWAKRYGFADGWAEHGFWRWKNLPQGQQNLAENLGLDISSTRAGPKDQLSLNIVKGVSPCKDSGFSLEGQFSAGVDLNRVSRVMPIFGSTKVSETLGALRTKSGENSITMFSSGSLVVRGNDEASIEHQAGQIGRAVQRAIFCQACGSCIPQCEHEALNLDEGKVSVDPEKCINCLKCDSWPCPTYLG